MNVLDLFAGIGGFALGLERAGMRAVAFCELDPYCRAVLAKHWPGVPCYDDVRTLTADRLRADRIAVDVVCGGFPCQDISSAGKGAGIDGSRSGLWSEFARIVGELRPRFVIVENVAALLARGLDRVLGDMASLGFDAEWHCIPACAVGAPHFRNRVWIIAADARRGGLALGQRLLTRRQIADAATEAPDRWHDLSTVGRAVHGLPYRMDRVRALGNAVLPQISELIGNAIMRASMTKDWDNPRPPRVRTTAAPAQLALFDLPPTTAIMVTPQQHQALRFLLLMGERPATEWPACPHTRVLRSLIDDQLIEVLSHSPARYRVTNLGRAVRLKVAA